MIKQKFLFPILVIAMCFCMLFPGVSYASAGVPGEEVSKKETVNDRSESSWLYGQDLGDVYGSAGETDLSGEEEEDDDKPHVFTSLVISFFNGFTDKLYSLFDKAHITLDSIIMGRVDGHGVQIHSDMLGDHVVALFTFELMPGNIFGIISANVYAVIRSVIYVVMLCAVMAKVVSASWKGDGSRAILTFKNSINELAVTFFMLLLMPNILDLILYIRDVMLHLLYNGLAGSMGLDMSKVSGIAGVFRGIADKNILNALMYLGSVVITLWFLLQYIGLALTFCIYFFCFPFVCVNSLFSKNELMEWWKAVIGYSIVPVGDLVLLFIPALFGLIGDNFTISAIQFATCAMLIPARSVLRAAMGIRTNMAMELAAIGTLGGAMHMASGTMRAFGNVVGGVAQGVAGGVSDLRMSEMYSNASKDKVDLDHGKYEDIPSSGLGTNGFGKSASVDSSFLEGRRYSYGMGSKEQKDILNMSANTANFENPAFRGLSNERRAELYRQRGIQKLAGAAIGGVAGSIAGLGGAALGAGGGMFLGADKATDLGGRMAEAGSGFGVQAAKTGIEYGTGMFREIDKAGTDFYNMMETYEKGEAGKEARFGDYASLMGHEDVPGVDLSSSNVEADLKNEKENHLGNNYPEQPLVAENVDSSIAKEPIGKMENISIDYITNTLDGGLSLKNPKFRRQADNVYSKIMEGKENGTYTTEKQCVEAMTGHMINRSKPWYEKRLRQDYPNMPDVQIDNNKRAVKPYINKKYGYNELTGENGWQKMAQIQLGEDLYSFKD